MASKTAVHCIGMTSSSLTCVGVTRGLISHPDVLQIHRWISDGSSLMSEAEFICCMQLRAGVLPTAKRASRGRPAGRVDCDACGRIETVGHIFQVCQRTWGHRIKRHDKLSNFVAGKLTLKRLPC